MIMEDDNMKVKDGIMGLVIGDALGVPVEFKSRRYLEKTQSQEWGAVECMACPVGHGPTPPQ